VSGRYGPAIISGKAFLEDWIAGSSIEECQWEYSYHQYGKQYNKPFPHPRASSADGLCRDVAEA
jgi:hypothetical protein